MSYKIAKLFVLVVVLISASVSSATLEQLEVYCGTIRDSQDCRDCCGKNESECVGNCVSIDFACYSACFRESRTCTNDCSTFFPSV